jgi:hypothetical protein
MDCMTAAGRPAAMRHFMRKSAFSQMQNLPRGDRAFSAAKPKCRHQSFDSTW